MLLRVLTPAAALLVPQLALSQGDSDEELQKKLSNPVADLIWSLGALVTQLWSFAGDGDRADVNQFQLQPIINYRLSAQHSVGYIGTITANWDQPSGRRWTVPLGASYSILTRPSWIKTPVNYIIGGGKNVERPDNVGDWFFRFQVNFVFPK